MHRILSIQKNSNSVICQFFLTNFPCLLYSKQEKEAHFCEVCPHTVQFLKAYLPCSRAKVTVVASQTSVGPISALVGAIAVVYIEVLLPFALSFAAGAMVLVAVHELIPDCQSGKANPPYSATMGIILGFAIMMLLDVMLG